MVMAFVVDHLNFYTSILDTSPHLIISTTLVCIKCFYVLKQKLRKKEDKRFASGAQLVREVTIMDSVKKTHHFSSALHNSKNNTY